MQDQDNGRLTYNVAEAAKILGLSKNSCYQGVLRNEIPHIKVGKRVLIPKRALEAMLESAGNGKPEED